MRGEVQVKFGEGSHPFRRALRRYPFKARQVIAAFCLAPPIPPGEPQAVVAFGGLMVQMMVRGGGKASPQPVGCKPSGHGFYLKMTNPMAAKISKVLSE
jgi:hypothetical protein